MRSSGHGRARRWFMATFIAAAATSGCRARQYESAPRSPIVAEPPALGSTGAPLAVTAAAEVLPEGGARLEVDPVGLTLDVPASMAEIVYIGGDLEQLRGCTRHEWDPEFGLVTDATLPFDRLVAHFGGDPFCGGVSFAPPHVRVYLLDEDVETAARDIARRGAEAIRTMTGKEPPPRKQPDPKLRYRVPEGWTSVPLDYRRFYIDYGGPAQIDTFLRRFDDTTVAVVVWYTTPLVQHRDGRRTDPIAELLSSVTGPNEEGRP